MYNYLFIDHAQCSDRDIIYTQMGNLSDYSAKYRADVWNRYVGLSKDITRGFYVICKDDDECRHLQRVLHEVFKGYITEKCIISMPKKIEDSRLKKIIELLKNHLYSEDKYKIRTDMFKSLYKYYPFATREGGIYLLRIQNKVFKIGLTNDLDRRVADLKAKYGTVDVIDYKQTDTMEYDEAALHIMNGKYKSPDNCLGAQISYEKYCSELYKLDKDVLYNWEQYWSNK